MDMTDRPKITRQEWMDRAPLEVALTRAFKAGDLTVPKAGGADGIFGADDTADWTPEELRYFDRTLAAWCVKFRVDGTCSTADLRAAVIRMIRAGIGADDHSVRWHPSVALTPQELLERLQRAGFMGGIDELAEAIARWRIEALPCGRVLLSDINDAVRDGRIVPTDLSKEGGLDV